MTLTVGNEDLFISLGGLEYTYLNRIVDPYLDCKKLFEVSSSVLFQTGFRVDVLERVLKAAKKAGCSNLNFRFTSSLAAAHVDGYQFQGLVLPVKMSPVEYVNDEEKNF